MVKYDTARRGSIDALDIPSLLYDLGIEPNNTVSQVVQDFSHRDSRFRSKQRAEDTEALQTLQQIVNEAELKCERSRSAAAVGRVKQIQAQASAKAALQQPELPTHERSAPGPSLAFSRALEKQLARTNAEQMDLEKADHAARMEKQLAIDALASFANLQAENRVCLSEFRAWFEEHTSLLFGSWQQPSEYTAQLQGAIYYFKQCDTELSGELSRTEFREMCEMCNYTPADIDESIALIQRTAKGSVRLHEYINWYTDDGLIRNTLASFDAQGSRKLKLDDFQRLCSLTTPGVDPTSVEQLFEEYDCTNASQVQEDESQHIAEWLVSSFCPVS